MKEKLWEDFDCVMMDVSNNEQIYVGGDFNWHVGCLNEGYERVYGGWGFIRRNDKGKSLLEAALAFDFAISNTWFKKKEEHLITYQSGGHMTQLIIS